MKQVKALILLCVLFTAPAFASYISLPTSVTTRVAADRLEVKVNLTNRGDESAYNVRVEVEVGDQKKLSDKQAELRVGAAFEGRALFPLRLTRPGTYPLIITVHYTDANQYPFSALTAQTYIYKQETTAPVFGQIKPVSFSKDGKLELTVKNSASSLLKLKTFLLAPRELTVGEESRELELGPKSEAKLAFAVKNFSALSGSTYQVFAVTQFEDQGLHYTTLSPGVIRIGAEAGFFGLGYAAVIIILGLLTAIFIGAQFFNRGQ
jgi:hypothetical protein